MEGGGGGIRRRVTLLDQMSAVDNSRGSLAGLTLDDVLGTEKNLAVVPRNHVSRTLFDIIREEQPSFKDGHRDKKTWKTFREKLRLKRAGAAWTSSVHIPASDIPIQNNSHRFSRRGSFRSNSNASNHESPHHSGELAETLHTSDPVSSSRSIMFTRRASTRIGSITPSQTESIHSEDAIDISMPSDAPPSRSFRPQISRHNSARLSQLNAEHQQEDDDHVARERTRRLGAALTEEKALSAREAVAAQEAAEAEAAAAAAAAEEEAAATMEMAAPPEPEPVRMSLMDLLEETDRQMGLVGSRYTMSMGDDDFEEEEEDAEEEEEGEEEGGMEYNCCVCMVRSKGAAFIPCGHTFCRLCSRELWVQRGNCPLCNGFILEILDIF